MIIPRRHLQVLDVLSVLLFSLLANFIFSITVDLSLPVPWVPFAKFVFLSGSCFLFYLTVDRLKQIASYCQDEYAAETSLRAKAERSVDQRYVSYCRPMRNRILARILISIVLALAFFAVDPLDKYLRAKAPPSISSPQSSKLDWKYPDDILAA